MEPRILVCSECGNRLVWFKNQCICDYCGIVTDSCIQFEESKNNKYTIPIQEGLGHRHLEPEIKKLMPHKTKPVLKQLTEESKFNETLFWYKQILFEIRDEIPVYEERFRNDYYRELPVIREKLKRHYIPSYLIAIVIIKYQLNKKITDFEPFIEQKDRNMYERLKKYETNKYELDINISEELIRRIERVREYIRVKTRYWIKPKIVGLMAGFIQPTTHRETRIRNTYRHRFKKLGITVQTLQEIN